MTEIKMLVPEPKKIIKGNTEYIVASEFGNQRLDELLSDYVAEKINKDENKNKVA